MTTVERTPLHQSPCLNKWRQWWKRIPKTCCHKKMLVLLVWQALFILSWKLLLEDRILRSVSSYRLAYILIASEFGSFIFAPFIGWLADVKLGRYKIIIYGAAVSFAANILSFVGLFTGNALGDVLSCISTTIVGLVSASFLAGMLPFMTDQIIGATADELSAVVYWYYWTWSFSLGLAFVSVCTTAPLPLNTVFTVLSAACLDMIIIGDCLCQQWLDRTHKITNPFKFIIQVFDYARKNSYPRRRSAFTYIDEEQPSRVDFGKDKFGGPFSEEEVENVKTVLRLLPLTVCISFSVRPLWPVVHLNAFNNDYINCALNEGTRNWIAPLLFITLYQFLLCPLFNKWVPSMLRRIGAGLFLQIVGYALCVASITKGYTHSENFTAYLTCNTTTMVNTAIGSPDLSVEWYWKLAPLSLYSVGKTIVSILLLEFAIAQSPDKMKGLVIGLIMAFTGISQGLAETLQIFFRYTVCYDLPVFILLTVLFMVFLLLSKHYKLRERNREINIQAIVEEYYERYLDQEEQQYVKEQHH